MAALPSAADEVLRQWQWVHWVKVCTELPRVLKSSAFSRVIRNGLLVQP